MKSKKRVLSFPGVDPLVLFGPNERHLNMLDERYPGMVVVRGEEIILNGDDEALSVLTAFFAELIKAARRGKVIDERDFRQLMERRDGKTDTLYVEGEGDVVVVTKNGYPIKPKTNNQREYAKAIQQHDVVLAIGPAGTGKTYLAVASAVAALKDRRIDRIFLVRPVVEAGESLGFLPGDFQAKLDPYMRPILDTLYEILGQERTARLQENGTIEIAPLAYMRGRTLNNAYVILDEAQNTTVLQMKMFLTRLGANAKAMVNGDITQIDLEPPSRSGLVAAQGILSAVEGIKFVYMKEEDIVRHKLVQRIISAFDQNGNTQGS
ncbi:MAG: PhoH family protein [Candidatus Latescibacterota bacterium]